MSVAPSAPPPLRRRARAAGAAALAAAARARCCSAGSRCCSTSGAARRSTSTSGTGSRGAATGTLDALLLPHNEHLSLVPVLVFKALFSTVGHRLLRALPGRRPRAPLRRRGAAVRLRAPPGRRRARARRRGDGPVPRHGWPDVLWPFQIGFLGSLAAGIGALLALDREDRRGDITAAVLLAVALASSSLGIPLLLAVALEVLGRPDRRRALVGRRGARRALRRLVRRLRRLERAATSDNLFGSPAYVAEAAAGAAGAVFALGRDWGRMLAVGAVVALLVSLHRRGHASWRLIALIAAPLGFWFLTAVARGHLGEPASPRYLYPGAVFLLLIAVEASAGARLARGALAVGAVFLAGALLGNVGAMREGAGFLRDESTAVDGALAALPLVAKRSAPDFQPDPDVGAADPGGPVPRRRPRPRLARARRRARCRGCTSGPRAQRRRDCCGARSARSSAPSAAGPAGAAPKVDFVQSATRTAKGACQTSRRRAGRARGRRRPARAACSCGRDGGVHGVAAALLGRLRRQAGRHRARRQGRCCSSSPRTRRPCRGTRGSRSAGRCGPARG